MTISVIIPVYNEEATIAEVVQQVARVPFNTEIIVVDDGSTDATPRILRDGVRAEVDCLCTLPRNRGKGAAIREGLRHATGDIVLIQDADLELLPEDYPQLLAPLFRGTARVVYGSRFLRGRGGARWLTYFTNRALTWWANLLFGTHLTDVAAGYKVFRAQVLRDLPLQAEGFEFCPEVTARLLRAGERICEVPVRYQPRPPAAGKKLRYLRDGAKAVWTLLKYRIQSPPATPNEVAK